jgi:hypothetical protein
MPEPPGLSPAAAQQAAGIGADMKSQGVEMDAAASTGPQQQEINAEGGYKVDAPAAAPAAPADDRPPADQVNDIRQSMSDAGVKSDNPPLSEEQTSRVETALANAGQSGHDPPSPDNSPEV